MAEKSLKELMAEDVGKGLESFDPSQEETNKRHFVKIVHPLSQEAQDGDYKAGTLIDSANKRLLADIDKDWEFIPLYYIKDYALWSDENELVLRSVNKSDFNPADLEWDGKNPPRVKENHNFIVVSADDTSTPMILSFSKTNNAQGYLFRGLIQDRMKSLQIPMFGAVYSLKVEKVTGKNKKTYFAFSKVKFVKEIDSLDNYKKLKAYHKELSDMKASQMLSSKASNEALPPHVEESTVITADEHY